MNEPNRQYTVSTSRNPQRSSLKLQPYVNLTHRDGSNPSWQLGYGTRSAKTEATLEGHRVGLYHTSHFSDAVVIPQNRIRRRRHSIRAALS